MTKTKLIADAKIRQDGVWLKSGDEFEATEEDAADLVAMKMAHLPKSIVDAVLGRAKRTYNRRDLVAK